MHSLMDDSERFLAPYQNLNAISILSNSDSSESDDSEYTKIPKLLSNAKSNQLHSLAVDRFMVNLF